MTIYNKMQATATRLLNKYTQGAVSLIRVSAPMQSANEWDLPIEGQETEYPLSAIVKGVSEQYVDNSTIVATDLEVSVSVFDTTPTLGDKIVIDGKDKTILKIIAVPSAGTVCLWKLIVR